jgi:hypothetical protein
MPVVVNHPAIPTDQIPPPPNSTAEIPIVKVELKIHKKLENLRKIIEAWTCQRSTVNEPGYRGYQTAKAHAMQADHASPPTPMGPNYQQQPWHEGEPCIYYDELRQIGTFCPNVRTDQDNSLVHLNEHGAITLMPRCGNGVEISRYGLKRTILSMRKYALGVPWD